MRDTSILYNGQWGVFMHFLSDRASPQPMTPKAWNAVVDGFDVAGLARELHQVRAGYLMFTAGQNSGYFCAPNPVYDQIVGHPEPHTSRRDLVAELAEALKQYEIPLFVYIPANPPFKDLQAVDAFEFCDVLQCTGRQAEFQRKWERMLRHWSERWGSNIAGWWVDGCYLAGNRKLYCHADEPNFASFGRALRAGNPESLVAWNPGVDDPELRTVAPEEDYTAGECQYPESVRILGRFEEQAQSHVLSYIGKWWGWREPRYTSDSLIAASRNITDAGGAITWDVPFEADGHIVPEFLTLLDALKMAYQTGRTQLPKPERAEARILNGQLMDLPVASSEEEGELNVRLQLRNTRSFPVTNQVSLTGERMTVTPAEASYTLAPGEETAIRLRCRLNDGVARGVLRVKNGNAVRQFDVRERRRFDLSRKPEVWHFPNRRGRLQMEWRDGQLYFELTARDSLRRQGDPVFSGSCVELFGAPIGNPGEIRQVFASPFVPGHLLRMANYRPSPVPDSELKCEWLADGFRLNGVLPLSCMGWQEDGLFECALHAGESDSYVYSSLFDSFYAAGSSRDYAELKFLPMKKTGKIDLRIAKNKI